MNQTLRDENKKGGERRVEAGPKMDGGHRRLAGRALQSSQHRQERFAQTGGLGA